MSLIKNSPIAVSAKVSDKECSPNNRIRAKNPPEEERNMSELALR